MNFETCTYCPGKHLDEVTGHCRLSGLFYLDVQKCEYDGRGKDEVTKL